jgi:hypothetical protein
LGAPPAIRTRVNNRFDGGRVLSGVAASHSEVSTLASLDPLRAGAKVPDRSYALFARRLAFPRIHASPAKPF